MNITLLEKRVIEAEAVSPILKAFAREVGYEKAIEIMTAKNMKASRRYGAQVARQLGSATLSDLAKEINSWGADGSLEEELLEQSESAFSFNVTRCRFAELYAQLGIKELGVALSCCRDFGFIQGFNPKIRLVRTQTIMEGASICDFRYHLEH